MRELEKLRDKIDEWDQQLIKAFEGRLETVEEVLEYKRKYGLPVYDRTREDAVIDRVLKHLTNHKYRDEAESLFRALISISRKVQSKTLFPFNIVMIGFMGTGKTTIGKILSEGLDMDFVDIDALIEERVGMKITQYFEQEGEAAFRRVEKAIIEEVSAKSNTVISCGGGVVLDNDNISNLRKNGKIVLLRAMEDTIFNRLKKDDTRPLLKTQNPMGRIKELLDARNKLYLQAADYIMDTDHREPKVIVDELIKRMLNH